VNCKDKDIKNNIATLISHVCLDHNILAKTIHHAINFTSTEVKLLAIRCRINQVIQVTDVTCIIIITDAIHSVRQIFDSLSHSYQLQSITITQDLKAFFNKNSYNSTDFWDCPDSTKIDLPFSLLTKKQNNSTTL